jgi:ribosomal protein S1
MKSKFKRKSGQITEGTITKINNKSIKLNCGVHGNWRVHPSFIIVD